MTGGDSYVGAKWTSVLALVKIVYSSKELIIIVITATTSLILHFLCPRQSYTSFNCVSLELFSSCLTHTEINHSILWGRNYFYSYFTNEKMKFGEVQWLAQWYLAGKGNSLTQLVTIPDVEHSVNAKSDTQWERRLGGMSRLNERWYGFGDWQLPTFRRYIMARMWRKGNLPTLLVAI